MDVLTWVSGPAVVEFGCLGCSANGLSRIAMQNIHQNLFCAFIYNTADTPVATGLLLRAMITAATMIPRSVSVVGSALQVGTAALI